MASRTKLLTLVALLFFAFEMASAQLYFGPFVGFNASGLKGTFKSTTQGGTTTGNVADGGSTAFTFGINAGYQIFRRILQAAGTSSILILTPLIRHSHTLKMHSIRTTERASSQPRA